MSRRSTLLIALGLPLVACATTDDSENTAFTSQAQITNFVATPDNCNQGVAPGNCVQAPPVTVTSEPLRWKVDGLFSPGEYSGATQMPYTLTTQTLGGYGSVFVNRVTNTQAAAPDKDVLFVYLKDLTVPVGANKVPQGKIDLYFDYARFEGADAFIAAEDRRIQVDLDADKLVAEFKVAGSGASASWTPMPSPEAGLEFRSGGCILAATGTSATCSGELQIPLPASVLTKPVGATFDDPGIGFYVAHSEVNGNMPELPATSFTAARTERTLWETVVFGRPRGFPLKIMSWNVHHGNDDDFEKVSNDDLGQFLAMNDIVALQEVWQAADAQKIADAANAVRASQNLKPFHVYGPVDMTPGWHQLIVQTVDAFKETQGGMFVLTPFETAEQGNLVFTSDDCRGDDCFRAHGVQWLRLVVDDPGFTGLKCRDGSTQNCAKPPSGDDYVDFFNVTLQSEDPPTCDDLDTWHTIEPGLKSAIDQLPPPFSIIFKLIIEAADFLIEDDLHCTSLTSSGVRDTQLGLVNDFIGQITAPKDHPPDRPSIIAGNFNIDGRNVNDATYQAMLAKLGISEPGSSSDVISEVNTQEWDWDIDHGDLAKERADIDFSTGRCLGTVIGATGGTADLSCQNDGKFDGTQRTSYILIRPRALPSAAAALPPATWMAAKTDAKSLTWSAPFPSNNGSTGGPPDRLSDKKPVVADVLLVPWQTPAMYHPTWGHEAKLLVSSVDGTMFDDCWGCGDIDPYAKLSKSTAPSNLSASKQTTECTGIPTPSRLVDGCMGDWFFTQTQVPGTIDSFTIQAGVWDADDTSADDPLNVFTQSSVTFNTGPNQGSYLILAHDPLTNLSATEPKTFFDTMPLGMCSDVFWGNPMVPTESALATVCHRMELTETPPAGP